MAVQEHFEGFDTAPDEMSRSAHKREAQGIRKLADKVASLGDTAFGALKFEEAEVREAFMRARRLRRNSDERRRQLQYAAKLLRLYGHEDLERQLNGMSATAKEDPKAMRLEMLREYLIHGGIRGVNSMVELIPSIDRNKLRSLVRRAHDELTGTLPDRPAARELFRYIKGEVNRAGVEIPESMLRGRDRTAAKAKGKAESEDKASAEAEDKTEARAGESAETKSDPASRSTEQNNTHGA